MKKRDKGEYGYLTAYKTKKIGIATILLIMIVFIIITLMIMFGDTKRVAVVFPILLSLPFAKYLIAYIAVAKFKPMSDSDYEQISSNLSEEQLIYDVVLSKYEGMMFYNVLCIKNGWVYAYVSDKDFDALKANYSTWIKDTVNEGKYEYKVGIYKNRDTFIKKVKRAGTPNDRTKLIDKFIKDRILELGV